MARAVNAARDLELMFDLGIDGIVSDRPSLVREAMQRRGLPLPRATPVAPEQGLKGRAFPGTPGLRAANRPAG